MLYQQLQTPSFERPYIESVNIRMSLDDIEYRYGDPLMDAEGLLQTAEKLLNTGLTAVTKETIWAQIEGFFVYLCENHSSDFSIDDEEGEQIIILSLSNRFYLEDYCASAMTRKQLHLLTENNLKPDKLKSLYLKSYATSVTLKGADEDFEPFKLELKDEARQWFKGVPEKPALAEQGWVQPHVRGPLKRFLKGIGEEQD